MTHFNYLLARQRQAELLEQAERGRRIRDARRRRPAPNLGADGPADVEIRLRFAGPADGQAIEELAGLDSAGVPAAPVLLAEVDGKIHAALSLRDGAMIADPFHRTLGTQQLLRARAAQLRGGHNEGTATSRPDAAPIANPALD